VPTVLRIEKFRFFFYSNEFNEPPHIHVQHDNKIAKFWLKPISLAKSTRFSSQELRKIENLIEQNEKILMEAWNEYFYTK